MSAERPGPGADPSMASAATGPSGTMGRSLEERAMVWAATLVLVFGLGATDKVLETIAALRQEERP